MLRKHNQAVSTSTGACARRLVVAALCLTVFAVAPVHANDDDMSMDDAVSMVRSQYKGARILKAEPRLRDDGSQIYRFRLLTSDGMVKTIRIRANNKSGDKRSNKQRNKKRQRKP